MALRRDPDVRPRLVGRHHWRWPSAAALPVRALLAVALVAVAAIVGGSTAGLVRAQVGGPTSTTSPGPGTGVTTPGLGSPTSTTSAGDPSGQVAYVTPDGRVWVGQGDAGPIEVAQGAALGRGGQGGVAVAPTGDVVAFIRGDGALVVVPIAGGAPVVLATDAVTSSLGRDPSLAWDATGANLAYLAVGTQDMAVPRSATPRPLSGPGVFRVPLPEGVLGNVVKVVSREGRELTRIGDPSERSYVGVTVSPSDDLLVLESVIPGTNRRYTLVAATSSTEIPTYFSADDPAFAPDGRYVVAVGPAKGRRELVRIDTDTLTRSTLATSPTMCNPNVSPDGTRIVYGGGRRCSRLMLVSSKGGRPVDITPPGTSDAATFGVATPGWTTDGRWLTLAPCRNDAERVECDGPIGFLDPDTGQQRTGPTATTVAPIVRPLVQDVYFDVDLRGPVEFSHSFLIDPTVQGTLTNTEVDGGRLKGRMVDEGTALVVDLSSDGGEFVTGAVSVRDPESGLDRSFMVLGRMSVLGVRVFSISGVWISTDGLPWATGKFDMAIRRR